MATKALEIDFGVIVGSLDTDGRVAQLVEIPVRRIFLPECICLAVGKTSIAVRREISAPGKPGLALGDKQRSRPGLPTGEEVFIQQCPNSTGEKHLARAITFAMNGNRTIWPGKYPLFVTIR